MSRNIFLTMMVLGTFGLMGQNKRNIDSLNQVLRTALTDIERVDVLNALASEYNSTDSTLTAFYTSKAISLAEEIGYVKGLTASYFYIGWMTMLTGHNYKAIELFQKAQFLADSMSYDKDKAKAMNGIGVSYQRLGNFDLALDYQFQSLDIYEKLGDSSRIAVMFNNLGVLYSVREDYDEAIRYYQQSLEIKEKMGDDSPATLNNIGNLYLDKNDYKNALEYCERALILNQKINSTFGQAHNYTNIGGAYLGLERYDLALENLERAYRLHQEIGNAHSITNTVILIGEAYYLLNDLQNAKTYLELGIREAEEINNPLGVKNGTDILAKVYDELGNYKEAFQAIVHYNEVYGSLQDAEVTKNLERLKAEYQFRKEKDSIAFANEKARLALETEIIRTKSTQQATFMALIFLLVLIAIILFFYQSKQRANVKLTELNKKVNQQKDSLQETLDKLQTTQTQLFQAEKMASLGVLSAGVGHEINNPLNFIKGGIEGLNQHIKEDCISDKSDIKRFLEIVNEGVNRASSIVNSLAHFSRESTTLDEECDIHAILDNCLLLLQNRLKHKVKVVKDYTKEPMKRPGNQGRLHQAFINILTNAEQAICGNGEIQIRTERVDHQIKITIKDNGAGIECGHLEKIMDPFFTTKAPGEGTGLGLSITYNIVEEHNGEINVQSKVGQGSSFSVTLPV